MKDPYWRIWDSVCANRNDIATLFKKLPNLELGVPIEKINYTPLMGDVGIVDLPVKF